MKVTLGMVIPFVYVMKLQCMRSHNHKYLLESDSDSGLEEDSTTSKRDNKRN